MKDIEIIKALVGEGVTEDDLKYTDCYVRPQMGLFIPAAYSCGYAARENHTHPSYMTVVYFEERADRRSHYKAQIFSPDIPHSDSPGNFLRAGIKCIRTVSRFSVGMTLSFAAIYLRQ